MDENLTLLGTNGPSHIIRPYSFMICFVYVYWYHAYNFKRSIKVKFMRCTNFHFFYFYRSLRLFLRFPKWKNGYLTGTETSCFKTCMVQTMEDDLNWWQFLIFFTSHAKSLCIDLIARERSVGRLLISWSHINWSQTRSQIMSARIIFPPLTPLKTRLGFMNAAGAKRR